MGLLQVLVNSEASQWRIESAGVWAQAGYLAAANTQEVVRQKGGDVRQHVSRPVTRELVAEFNLILTMERGQKEALQVAFPQYASRVWMLTELVGQAWDIADPIGGPLPEFETTAREIDDVLHQGLPQLRRLAADPQPPEV